MIDPEQAEFRRKLRAVIRNPPVDDDDDWQPRRRWDEVTEKRRPGPPPNPNPSPGVLATQRYRARLKARREEAPGEPGAS